MQMRFFVPLATSFVIGLMALAPAIQADARLYNMDRKFNVGTLRNFARTTYEYAQGGRAMAEAAKRATLIASTHWLQSTKLPGDVIVGCGSHVNKMDEWKWIQYKGSLPDDAEVVAAVATKTLNELVKCIKADPAVHGIEGQPETGD